MSLDTHLEVGRTVDLGSETFTVEAIKAFAAKYDPQPFHLDEEAARASVLGGLCASGWHTAAAWMKRNVATNFARGPWTGPGAAPVFGPSPGFRNMKWPKPVYAGETVTYTRRVIGHRPLASRPGWRLISLFAEGADLTGARVIEFENSVLVKAD